MALVGLAPCQCFSAGGIHTVSPGRISRIGPPQVCTRPSPATTWRVCPSGWVCHAVRAPGSKLTRAARMRAGAGASMIGSCHTVPVNQSPDMRRDGTDPDSLMSMIFPRCGCRLEVPKTFFTFPGPYDFVHRVGSSARKFLVDRYRPLHR